MGPVWGGSQPMRKQRREHVPPLVSGRIRLRVGFQPCSVAVSRSLCAFVGFTTTKSQGTYWRVLGRSEGGESKTLLSNQLPQTPGPSRGV